MDNFWGYNTPTYLNWQQFPSWSQYPNWSLYDTSAKENVKKEETPSEVDAAKKYDEFSKVKKATLDSINIDNTIKEAEKTQNEIKEEEKNSRSKTNISKWLSNGWAAVKNIGKSIIGYDEKGFNLKKCLRNVLITGAAIGASAIPVVGPYISFGLLAAGAIGGTVGVVKGAHELSKAKTSEQIDKAEQNIISNAITGIASIFGLRYMGASFRTAAATSSQASAATSRTGIIGKTIENTSNFARDITVNAWRSTKLNAANSALSLKSIKSLEKMEASKLSKLRATAQAKLTKIETKISATSDPAKLALLKEQKMLIEHNLAEINNIGSRIGSQAEYQELMSNNSAIFNRDLLQSGYSRNASGQFEINGHAIGNKNFELFRNNALQEQMDLNAKMYELVQIKEALMKKYAANPNEYTVSLDKYIKTSGIEKNPFNPADWAKNKYQIALRQGSQDAGKTSTKGLIKYTIPTASLAAQHDKMPFVSSDTDSDKLKEYSALVDEQIKVLNKIKYSYNKEDFEKLIAEYQELEKKIAEFSDNQSNS